MKTRCWLLHRWTRWEDKESGELGARSIFDKGAAMRVVGRFVHQQRRCERCNAVQLRTSRTLLTD